jgi:hypothetical protein
MNITSKILKHQMIPTSELSLHSRVQCACEFITVTRNLNVMSTSIAPRAAARQASPLGHRLHRGPRGFECASKCLDIRCQGFVGRIGMATFIDVYGDKRLLLRPLSLSLSLALSLALCSTSSSTPWTYTATCGANV